MRELLDWDSGGGDTPWVWEIPSVGTTIPWARVQNHPPPPPSPPQKQAQAVITLCILDCGCNVTRCVMSLQLLLLGMIAFQQKSQPRYEKR